MRSLPVYDPHVARFAIVVPEPQLGLYQAAMDDGDEDLRDIIVHARKQNPSYPVFQLAVYLIPDFLVLHEDSTENRIEGIFICKVSFSLSLSLCDYAHVTHENR